MQQISLDKWQVEKAFYTSLCNSPFSSDNGAKRRSYRAPIRLILERLAGSKILLDQHHRPIIVMPPNNSIIHTCKQKYCPINDNTPVECLSRSRRNQRPKAKEKRDAQKHQRNNIDRSTPPPQAPATRAKWFPADTFEQDA